MKLYNLEVSGNCYKVRLLCALLGVPVEIAEMDFLGGEHKRSPHIDRNAFAQIPVLEDDGLTLRDSQAILVYVARKWGGEAGCRPTPRRSRRHTVVDGSGERNRTRSKRCATAR